MYPADLDQPSRRTPRMDRQIDRITTLLAQSPMTVSGLARALFIGHASAGTYIRLLKKANRVHVCGWEPTPNNRPAAVYALGNHPDQVYVSGKKGKIDTRREDGKQRLLDLLVLPQTVNQLANLSGFSGSRARFYVGLLKKEKRIYIKGWALPAGAGSQAPMYAIGNQPDAMRVRRAKQKLQSQQRRFARQQPRRVSSAIFAALGI